MAKLVETAKLNKPQPTLNITEDEMPEIKGWKVGAKYSINLDVELVRLSKGDVFMPESNRKMEATFKVISTGSDKKMMEKKPEDEMKMKVMKKKMGEY